MTDQSCAHMHRTSLHATANLMSHQFRIHESIRNGRRPTGVDIIGVGLPAIRRALQRHKPSRLQSLYPTMSMESLEANSEFDFQQRRRGQRYESVYHPGGFDSVCEQFIVERQLTGTATGPALVQMKVYDRRAVILEGPDLGGDRSALLITREHVVRAALGLLDCVFRVAQPLRPPCDAEARLTARQREVVAMLADEIGDVAMARRMGVCPRTARSEVAAVLRATNSSTRFGAGYHLGKQAARRATAR